MLPFVDFIYNFNFRNTYSEGRSARFAVNRFHNLRMFLNRNFEKFISSNCDYINNHYFNDDNQNEDNTTSNESVQIEDEIPIQNDRCDIFENEPIFIKIEYSIKSTAIVNTINKTYNAIIVNNIANEEVQLERNEKQHPQRKHYNTSKELYLLLGNYNLSSMIQHRI